MIFEELFLFKVATGKRQYNTIAKLKKKLVFVLSAELRLNDNSRDHNICDRLKAIF